MCQTRRHTRNRKPSGIQPAECLASIKASSAGAGPAPHKRGKRAGFDIIPDPSLLPCNKVTSTFADPFADCNLQGS